MGSVEDKYETLAINFAAGMLISAVVVLIPALVIVLVLYYRLKKKNAMIRGKEIDTIEMRRFETLRPPN